MAENDLFSYTDIAAGSYTFDDLYTPGSEAYDYEGSGEMPSPDKCHAELYLDDEDHSLAELTEGESKALLESMKKTTYTPLDREAAYELGLIKDSNDGKFKNMTAVQPTMMFYYYSIYPESVMGEYYSIVVDVVIQNDEVYLILQEQNTISDVPSATHKCIVRADTPQVIVECIENIRNNQRFE